MFPASKVCHLECGTSDHKPIVVHPKGIPKRKQKPWRLEQVWLSENSFHDVVKWVWRSSDSGCYMEDVVVKVNRCKKRLQHWCKVCFGNITKSLNDKQVALKKVETEALTDSNYENVFTLKKEITELLANEEKLW